MVTRRRGDEVNMIFSVSPYLPISVSPHLPIDLFVSWSDTYSNQYQLLFFHGSPDTTPYSSGPPSLRASLSHL